MTLNKLREVFDCFQKAGLKLQAKECKLFQTSVSYLGHIASEKGVECDPSNVRVVQERPEPTNVHEVRSFSGTATYYRRFV